MRLDATGQILQVNYRNQMLLASTPQCRQRLAAVRVFMGGHAGFPAACFNVAKTLDHEPHEVCA